MYLDIINGVEYKVKDDADGSTGAELAEEAAEVLNESENSEQAVVESEEQQSSEVWKAPIKKEATKTINKPSDDSSSVPIIVGAAIIVVIASAVFFIVRKKKR